MRILALDPATVKAGAKFDVLIATKWMEWEAKVFSAPDVSDPPRCNVRDANDEWRLFEPSTNFAHAVEAMLKAEHWALIYKPHHSHFSHFPAILSYTPRLETISGIFPFLSLGT